MQLVLVYVVLIAFCAFVPLILNLCLSYFYQNKTLNLLIQKASKDTLDLKELEEFIKESGKAPGAITGIARTTMTLTTILILGVAVAHLLVIGAHGDNSQIINSILSMLAGLLAAITGFYFGGKTAEEKEKKKNNGSSGKPDA